MAVSKYDEVAPGGFLSRCGTWRLFQFEAVEVPMLLGFVVVNDDDTGFIAATGETFLG